MRQLMIVSAVALAVGTVAMTAQANSEQRAELRKQLEIMNSIFETSLKQENSGERRFSFGRSLEYNYLAGQGVVYRAQVGGNSFRMLFGNGAPTPPMPPTPGMAGVAPQIEVIRGGEDGDELVRMYSGDSLEGLVADEMEVIIESQEIVVDGDSVWVSDGESDESREKVRDITRAMRDTSREMRDVSRKIRDLEFSRRSANGEGLVKIESELEKARKDMRELEQEVQAESAKLQAINSERQEKIIARRAERDQQRAERIAQFEQTMAQTLCDYGRTLRSLPNGENITFILEGAGDKSQGGEDKIFIFSKRNVTECSGSDGASDLLAQAVTYSF